MLQHIMHIYDAIFIQQFKTAKTYKHYKITSVSMGESSVCIHNAIVQTTVSISIIGFS